MARGKSVARFLLLGAVVLSTVTGCASGGADAPAAPPPPAVVGSWDLVIETPIGTQESVLSISGTAELLEGTITGEQGEAAIRDVVFDGGKLNFGMTIDAQGTPMELTFEGAVDGDNLTGAFQSPFGPAPVTGKRGGT